MFLSNQSMANVNADYGSKTILTDKYNSRVLIVSHVLLL
ncbi:Late-stage biofilm-induced protein [Candida albicans SC5314]|nr:Late-stage biofilm-induced protein [Candida albicans SC5314]